MVLPLCTAVPNSCSSKTSSPDCPTALSLSPIITCCCHLATTGKHPRQALAPSTSAHQTLLPPEDRQSFLQSWATSPLPASASPLSAFSSTLSFPSSLLNSKTYLGRTYRPFPLPLLEPTAPSWPTCSPGTSTPCPASSWRCPCTTSTSLPSSGCSTLPSTWREP